MKADELIDALAAAVAHDQSQKIDREKPTAAQGSGQPIRQENERYGEHRIEHD